MGVSPMNSGKDVQNSESFVPGQAPGLPRRPADAAPVRAAEQRNSATRYLCTGVRLYEDFARRVVDETRFERIRARAPSYGVDLDEVREHAEASLRDLRVRDRWVSAAFVLALVISPATTVVYVFVSGIIGGIMTGSSRRKSGARGVYPQSTSAGRVHLTKPQGSTVTTIAAPLLAQAVVLFFAGQLGQRYLWSPPGFFFTYILGLLLLIGCPWYYTWRQRVAAWEVVREKLGPTHRRASRNVADHSNFVAYSGYSPFVGSGVQFSSWSFANRLVPEGWKPGSGQRPPPVPFGSSELVERLSADLAELRAQSPDSADGIVGLEVSEKVFVHGSALLTTRLAPQEEIWPGGGKPGGKRPTDRLPDERITAARGLVDGPVRHCLCVQIRSWDTDLVLTVFVQVSVNGGTLYLQSDTRVLAPVREMFRVADSLHTSESAEEGAQRAAESAVSATGVLLASVPHVLAELGAGRQRERWEKEERWALEHDRRYDFGARNSLREDAASTEYRNFFQLVDVSRAGKQVELQVLGSVMNFLAEHELDVSDLDARRTTILNNGVMMYGGSVTGSIAAGPGAKATATGLGPAGGAGGGRGGAGTGAGAG